MEIYHGIESLYLLWLGWKWKMSNHQPAYQVVPLALLRCFLFVCEWLMVDIGITWMSTVMFYDDLAVDPDKPWNSKELRPWYAPTLVNSNRPKGLKIYTIPKTTLRAENLDAEALVTYRFVRHTL